MTPVLLLWWLFGEPPVSVEEIEAAQKADRAREAPTAGSPVAPRPDPPAPQAAARAPGSSLTNPALSVILDADFGYYGLGRPDFLAHGIAPAGDDPKSEGFGMQEIELAFQAAVDPYLEAALFLTVPDLEGVEVEEGYLVTTSLPWNLQLKAGTFRSAVGRNNTQHLHLQHFTRRPLLSPLLLGADGLRGPALQASVLLPLPWFATFYAEAMSIGAPEDRSAVATFGGGGRRDPENLSYTGVLEQYWDLSEDLSVLAGLDFASGKAFECAPMEACRERRSYLYGADLYVKWKPPNVVHTYASVQWTTEYFGRTIGQGGPTEGAFYTEPVVQVSRRFWVGARFDLTGLPSGPSLPRRHGLAGSLTFTPSEFSRVRVYGQELWAAGLPSATVAFLQAEVSIGAHGAHPF